MIHAENRLAPRMVLIITNHEYRRKLEQTFQNFRIPIYYQCQGHGTAPSEMLDIFGLSGSGPPAHDRAAAEISRARPA